MIALNEKEHIIRELKTKVTALLDSEEVSI